ncbi:hypothetical protein CHS0354_011403 [Potamilus streckersoni]|uniref:G-protein coupled receptors family 1 profile domain-containing protein n=1 Tax=Potamilus streckersoni TaxID=2493646 RepID=A0AAE0THF6_9BIVA|nr:hypothetical protein CHS0354_011403 [Potamilus streckersoni]
MSHVNATEGMIVDSEQFEDYSSFYYDGNIDKLRNPWVKEPHFVPLVIVYGIIFLVGIVGNSVVIFAMRGGRSARSVTFAFVVSLAMADLLFILVCVPHEILRITVNDWIGGQSFCKVSGFVELLTEAASILNLTGVSFESYASFKITQ